MAIGTAMFLIAAGAILHWAVTAKVSGLDIQTVGLILMLVGIVGLVVSFLWLTVLNDRGRDSGVNARDRDAY